MTDLLTSFLPSYFKLWHLPAIFVTGLIGEGYATVVGGGGVLIQFVLASFGMPMANIVATDVAGCLGSSLGVITTAVSPKKLAKQKKLILQLTIPLLLGGITGTLFLISIPGTFVKYVVIAGLSLLLLHALLGRKPTLQAIEDLHINMKHYALLFVVFFVIALYGNVSGVGSGTFFRLVFVSMLSVSVLDSLGIGIVVRLPAALFSVGVTALAGLIVWPYCLTLWLGTFIGGRYAVKFARKIPDRYLRWLLILLVSFYLIWLVVSL